MIIDSNNRAQMSIIANKCFYQTTVLIMQELEEKGYTNPADETAEVISAYHSLVNKKSKNKFSKDYNEAFKHIDKAIETIAHQVFFQFENKRFDQAYKSFEKFDHINAIVNRNRFKRQEAT